MLLRKRVMCSYSHIKKSSLVTVWRGRDNIGCIYKVYFFKRFYLFMRDRKRERERGRDTGRERSRLHAGSPMRLNPGTPGSRPGPKAGAKLLSHPGIPSTSGFKELFIYHN